MIIQSDKDVLLTVYNNQSDNIEFTKNRSYFILAAYSAISAFLINEKESVSAEDFECFLMLVYWIGTIVCLRLLQINCQYIKRRRTALEQVLEEINSDKRISNNLLNILETNLKKKIPLVPEWWTNKLPIECLRGDKHILNLSILYIVTIGLITTTFYFL